MINELFTSSNLENYSLKIVIILSARSRGREKRSWEMRGFSTSSSAEERNSSRSQSDPVFSADTRQGNIPFFLLVIFAFFNQSHSLIARNRENFFFRGFKRLDFVAWKIIRFDFSFLFCLTQHRFLLTFLQSILLPQSIALFYNWYV